MWYVNCLLIMELRNCVKIDYCCVVNRLVVGAHDDGYSSSSSHSGGGVDFCNTMPTTDGFCFALLRYVLVVIRRQFCDGNASWRPRLQAKRRSMSHAGETPTVVVARSRGPNVRKLWFVVSRQQSPYSAISVDSIFLKLGRVTS